MLLSLGILALLILLNGIFAMSELAMMTSRPSRFQQSIDAGHKSAATALALQRDPTRFLSTVQVGITLIGILAGAFGEKAVSVHIQAQIARVPALEPYSGTLALISVVLIITYFSLVIGELVPKRLALAFPEAIALLIARPLNALSVIAAAPVKLLTVSTEAILKLLRVKPATEDDVSEDDVNSLVARAATAGVFTPQEHALFQRTIRVGDLYARDLLVPRQDIVWINEDDRIETVRVLVGTSLHSHFPVCRGSLDDIIGVVHIKDLIAYGLMGGKDFKASVVAKPPLFVPEMMPVLKLLDQFRTAGTHIAFVVDEYGGTLGLITHNDVIGALVGHVARLGDEADPHVTQREDGSWLIDGRLPLHELAVTLDLGSDAEHDRSDVSTASGIITALLGHIPREGESITWRGWRFEVVDMDGKRIDQVLASKAAEPVEPAAEEEDDAE